MSSLYGSKYLTLVLRTNIGAVCIKVLISSVTYGMEILRVLVFNSRQTYCNRTFSFSFRDDVEWWYKNELFSGINQARLQNNIEKYSNRLTKFLYWWHNQLLFGRAADSEQRSESFFAQLNQNVHYTPLYWKLEFEQLLVDCLLNKIWKSEKLKIWGK